MARFALSRPTTIDGVVAEMAEDPEGSILLAGGQSLMILLRQGLLSPRVSREPDRVPELRVLERSDGTIRVGSMVTNTEVARSALLRKTCPLLARAAGSVGSIHIRNVGTVGGSLCHADPAGDAPTALLALDARLVTRTVNGPVSRGVTELMTGAFETTLVPGEVLVIVEVQPIPVGATIGYRRFHNRAGEYPLAVAACVLEWGEDGSCRRARIALGGAHACPRRLSDVEHAIVGSDVGPDARRRARELVVEGASAMGDVRGSAEWRALAAASLLEKALTDAATRPVAA